MGMTTMTRSSYIHRLIGAAALDVATFEEVEADPGATTQACATVLLSSVAVGIGAGGLGGGAAGVVLFCGVALLAWSAWALMTFEVGARILPGAQTRADVGQLLRTVGFASAPGMFHVFAVLPGLRAPVFAGTAVWLLLAMIVAVRQALDYTSTARAVAVCALGWVMAIAIALAAGFFWGPVVS
jgi:hypothetical protein